MIRQNFYNGQKVAPKNLNDLQGYVEGQNANLVSSILGYGIINGFSVQKESEMIISVSGGLAYTEEGVRLFSETGLNTTIPSSELPNAGDRTVSLALRFDWNKTGSATDSTGSVVTTDWEPSVLLKLGSDIKGTDLKIADIKLSPVGILEIIENGQRFLNFEQQVAKTKAFSTETTHEAVTANISADILNLNTNINIKNKTFEETIRDMVYPVGTVYTQYPENNGQFSSNSDPSTLFGGRWVMIHNHGVFFRTAWGANNNIVNEDRHAVDVNIQQDAVVRMTGRFAADDLATTGVFRHDGVSDHFVDGHNGMAYIVFDNALQVRTSSENRPRNMLIQIWRRTN